MSGPLQYLAEPLLASCGHTHVHLAILGGVAGGWRAVEVLLQVLHPCQQLRYSTYKWKITYKSNVMMISGESRFQYGALNALNENTYWCMLGN